MLGAVIAWVIGRRLARPLVELTGAAEALARGDYSERVGSHGTDEIGRLGVAFNRMAEQVQDSSNSSTEAVRQLTKSVSTQLFLAEASRILAGSLSDQTCSPSSRDTAFRRSATTAASTSPTTTARCAVSRRCTTTPRSRRWFESW